MRYFLIILIIFSIGSLIDNVVICISEEDEELVEKIYSETEEILKKIKAKENEPLASSTKESGKNMKKQQLPKKIQTFEKNISVIQDEINHPEDDR